MRIPKILRRKQATGSTGRKWRAGKSQVSIGRYTYGEDHLTIRQWGEGTSLTVGQFCSIADDITIFLGGNHRVDWATTFPFGFVFRDDLGVEKMPGHPVSRGNVVIGNDVWIGAGATLMSGISVGDGAVIAAKSVISKDVAPYAIVAGNPGKEIKRRFDPEITALLQKLAWWDLPVAQIREIGPQLSAAPTESALKALIARYRKIEADAGLSSD